MPIDPLFVFLHPLLPAFEFFWLSLVLFGEDDHLDRVVHHKRELENFSPDVFAALWALLSPHEALKDALVAKRMAADSDPTGHDEVHAYWAGEALHFFEGLKSGLFLLLNDLAKVVCFLVLFGRDDFWMSLFDLVVLAVSQNLSSQCVLNLLNLIHSKFRG